MTTIVKSLCFSFIVLAAFTSLTSVADARRFNVGGSGGWVLNPKENYNTWAERNRFQVNDTLYFKYPKGSDSVQQVMKADYDGCNVKNPLKSFVDGESVVPLNRSGPFFFISGNQDNCFKGQKLIVVVLAIRNHPMVPISPAKPPSSAQPPKSPSPASPVSPAKPPKTPSPISPIAPAKPPKSPSPVVSPSHAPSKSPTTSPSPKSPFPVSHSPAVSPSNAPSTSPSPDTTPSSDEITSRTPAPAPSNKNSASGVAVTSVMTAALTAAFTVLMFA